MFTGDTVLLCPSDWQTMLSPDKCLHLTHTFCCTRSTGVMDALAGSSCRVPAVGEAATSVAQLKAAHEGKRATWGDERGRDKIREGWDGGGRQRGSQSGTEQSQKHMSL